MYECNVSKNVVGNKYRKHCNHFKYCEMFVWLYISFYMGQKLFINDNWPKYVSNNT
jgi:hypothetical protein